MPSDNGKSQTSAAENEIRAALSRHWTASDANDFITEHEIYREDAVLDYPQSGERIRGRANIQTTRSIQPSSKRFNIRRILGSGNLWITEYILYYDEKPFPTVSVMEFIGGKVAHETQYFSEPFEPSAQRSRFVERMDT
jgi:SnoaL-like domain